MLVAVQFILLSPLATAYEPREPEYYQYNREAEPNRPAGTPMTPWGPSEVAVNKVYEYCTQAEDPDGDRIQYVFDWGDESQRVATGWYASGQTGCDFHAWTQLGNYQVRAYAQDTINPVPAEWNPPDRYRPVTVLEKIENQAPSIPRFTSGPPERAIGQAGRFCFISDDPDSDPIEYVIRRGKPEDTTAPQVVVKPADGRQGEGCATFTWAEAGTGYVCAYAQDLINPVRDWSDPCAEVAITPEPVVASDGGVGDGAPEIPEPPEGPSNTFIGQGTEYCAQSTDNEGDDIEYVFRWGDDTESVTRAYRSGQPGCLSHAWSQGHASHPTEDIRLNGYCVTVYAQDLINPVPGTSGCKRVRVYPQSQSYEPAPPSKPTAPSCTAGCTGQPPSLPVGEVGDFCTTSTDPNGDTITYYWQFGDGSAHYRGGRCVQYSWRTMGQYCASVEANDHKGGWANSDCTWVTIGSARAPPSNPGTAYAAAGVYQHRTSELVQYCARTTDINHDAIEYIFDWGDNTATTSERVNSGEEGCQYHAWVEPGEYHVRVAATDRNHPPTQGSGYRRVFVSAAPGDADEDLVPDSEETCNMYEPDSDFDGLDDRFERDAGTRCDLPDSDGDDLTDKQEVDGDLNAGHTAHHQIRGSYSFRTDVCVSENQNICKKPGATNPVDWDTDGDGLGDGHEVHGVYKSSACGSGPSCPHWFLNPNLVDTDGDSAARTWDDRPTTLVRFHDNNERHIWAGYWNGVGQNFDPTHFDPDGDMLIDAREDELGAHPFNWDTDNDRLADGSEAEGFGSDPRYMNLDKDSMPDLYDPDVVMDSDPPFLAGWEVLRGDVQDGLCLSVADQGEVAVTHMARRVEVETDTYPGYFLGPQVYWDNSTVVPQWDDTSNPPRMCLDYAPAWAAESYKHIITQIDIVLQDPNGLALHLSFRTDHQQVTLWEIVDHNICWVPYVGASYAIAKAVHDARPLKAAWGTAELGGDVAEKVKIHNVAWKSGWRVIRAVGTVACMFEWAAWQNQESGQTAMRIETKPEDVDRFTLKGNTGYVYLKVDGFEEKRVVQYGSTAVPVVRGEGYGYLQEKYPDHGWTREEWRQKLQSALTSGTYQSQCAGSYAQVCYTVVTYPASGINGKIYLKSGAIVDVEMPGAVGAAAPIQTGLAPVTLPLGVSWPSE